MGKYKRDKSKVSRNNPLGRASLGEQIVKDRNVDPADSKERKDKGGDVDPEFADEKTTRRILKEARKQQLQLEEDDLEANNDSKAAKKSSNFLGKSPDDEDSDVSEHDEGEGYEASDIEINSDDERAMELFMKKEKPDEESGNPSASVGAGVGDIILEKFTEKHTELESQFSDAGISTQKLDPRVEKMYLGVKDVMSKYRSGKVPKAFKIIPKLSNWEQILFITDPNSWTAASMYQATRMFTANLKEKMAQRFFNLVLLPRIRDDIHQYKQLNFHLFQSLRKALYKPGAFMKGIVIPLCESETCSLREATIIGSVMSQNSIPILHSCAAMLKIAEMNYSGCNSIFLKMFLDKKYALPYRVVDSVVYHFLKFERDSRTLPVLWHQSLLTFATRYKEYLSSEQKEALLKLLKTQTHHQITPEIRRELMNSKCRDEIVQENNLAKSFQEVKMG